MTAELDAAIKQLADAGHSAGEISRRVGATRNTVIGICRRRGYRLARARQPAATPLPTQMPAPAPAAGRASKARPGGGCRWPLWANDAKPDHRYCGKAVHAAGEPYCSTHRAIAWVKQTTRPGAPSEFVLPAKRSAILQTAGD